MQNLPILCEMEKSAGMDIKALQNVMGHSDASITMNVYNHSSFERTEKEQEFKLLLKCRKAAMRL